MTSAWEASTVQAGDLRLHVRRQTAPGSPLLLLHGLGASGAVWQAFARRLNPPWQCIAPDLRGHGESEKPLAGYAPDDYARDVATLAAGFGEGAVAVVGHSLGALVAIAVAAQSPERVRAAVLLDPPLDPDMQNAEVQEVFRLRARPAGELERYLAVPALAAIFRRAADGVFEAYLRTPRGARWAWAMAAQVAIPTLVVQADPKRGGMLGDAAAADFTERLGAGELVKVEGAGHAIHATHGGRVAEVVLDFLSRTG